MTGIRELFSELSGDEPDWFQMQFYFERQYEAVLERNRQHRKNNRIATVLRSRRYRAEHREDTRRYGREYQRKWRAEHHERAKAYQREQKRKWRAAKKAAKQAAPSTSRTSESEIHATELK